MSIVETLYTRIPKEDWDSSFEEYCWFELASNVVLMQSCRTTQLREIESLKKHHSTWSDNWVLNKFRNLIITQGHFDMLVVESLIRFLYILKADNAKV